MALVFGYPRTLAPDLARGPIELFAQSSVSAGLWRDPRRIEGPGFIGLDGETSASDAEILAATASFISERLRAADFHPDLWRGILIRDPARARDALAATAGDKYSYAELEAATDLIARTLKTSRWSPRSAARACSKSASTSNIRRSGWPPTASVRRSCPTCWRPATPPRPAARSRWAARS